MLLCSLNTLLIKEKNRRKHHIVPNDANYLLGGLKNIAVGKISEGLRKTGPTKIKKQLTIKTSLPKLIK